MRYENPVGASYWRPPAVATYVRLIESAAHKSSWTRTRCAREREDLDPAIFLERHCPTIDRAQMPAALRRFADMELDGVFSRSIENYDDILWLGD